MNATFFPPSLSRPKGKSDTFSRCRQKGSEKERDKGGRELQKAHRYKAHCCATVAYCTKVSPKFANLRFLLECDKDAERHRIIFLSPFFFSLLRNIFFAFHPLFPRPSFSTMTRGSRSIFLFEFVVAREGIKREVNTVDEDDDDNNNHRNDKATYESIQRENTKPKIISSSSSSTPSAKFFIIRVSRTRNETHHRHPGSTPLLSLPHFPSPFKVHFVIP